MRAVPSGAGLVVRRVRLAEPDVVLLGAILNGEDHFASVHGEPVAIDPAASHPGRVVVSVLTTEARARELDAWLEELEGVLGLERIS